MKTFFIFLACTFYFSATAQDSSIRLKDYKFRTPLFKTLKIRGDLSGSIDGQGTSVSEGKNRSFALMPTWITYTKFVSTDKVFKNSIIDFQPYYVSSTQKNKDEKIKNRNYRGILNYGIDNKYYRTGNHFFQLSNNFSSEFMGNRSKDSSSKNRHHNYWLNNSLAIGFGKGRIEYVEDLQMALYILEDLRFLGLIYQEPGTETIMEFARLISHVNYTRVLDHRRKRIFELTQIENFLREKNVIANPGIQHFTTINDNWHFAFNPTRRSGTTRFIRLKGKVEAFNSKEKRQDVNSYQSDIRAITSGFGPEAGYENFLPVNLRFQRDMGINISVQKNFYRTQSVSKNNGVEYKTKYGDHQLDGSINIFYGIGYYPNTRTQITAQLRLTAQHLMFSHSNIYKDRSSIKPAFELNANYFINYRTQMTAGISAYYERYFMNYMNNSNLSGHNMNGNVFVSLGHYIF